MEIDSKNILFIIIGLVFLVIIGVVIYLIAKSKSKSTPPSNQICSVSNQSGTCPDTYNCTQGICKTTVPPSSSCSALNPTGKCGALGWICSGGTCTDPSTCSASNPNGSCTQYGTVCTNGTCIIPQSTDCSPTNLKGNCPTGLSCVGGTCTDPSTCSASNPNGKCTQYGTVCRNGTCIIPQSTDCSPTNLKGNCPPELSCVGGTCRACISNCIGKNCGDIDNCNKPCQGPCTESGQTCVGGTCTACISNCSGKNCGDIDNCNKPCQGLCTESGQTCVGGTCIPSCTGNGDNCNNQMSCTCPLGTNCESDGKCVQLPIIIKSKNGNVVTLSNPLYYVNNMGGSDGAASSQNMNGCWSLDDTIFLPLKENTNSCLVDSITLPANINAEAYNVGEAVHWWHMCNGYNTAHDCPADSTTTFPDSTFPDSVCGFWFKEKTV